MAVVKDSAAWISWSRIPHACSPLPSVVDVASLMISSTSVASAFVSSKNRGDRTWQPKINKRSVHRAMEIMGVRAGTEMQALAFTTESTLTYLKEFRKGVRQALSLCDKTFGDYRERKKE